MGGYVAGPPVMAALLRARAGGRDGAECRPGIHQSLHRPLRRRARWSPFRRPPRFFPSGRTEVTGLPVREEFFRIQPKPRGAVLQLLITGGSQGSRTLNHAAQQSWPLFRKAGFPIRIVHQTGAAGFAEDRATPSRRSGLEGEVVPFIADMPAAFAAADLIVCRSGAGAVSELAAAGKPSILVPFPFAADDHQTRNAAGDGARRRGAPGARREMTGEKLFETVSRIIADLDSHGRGRAAVRQARRGRARRRRSGGGRTGLTVIFSIDSCPISRNNTIRKCFFGPSTFISRELEASA